ncbi:hypothetical protein K9L16_02030 [Candidatus Pacearchaeota archaeon]|nr:hypothetical protein [Candidatus Pacearchaeota archaeon]
MGYNFIKSEKRRGLLASMGLLVGLYTVIVGFPNWMNVTSGRLMNLNEAKIENILKQRSDLISKPVIYLGKPIRNIANDFCDLTDSLSSIYKKELKIKLTPLD